MSTSIQFTGVVLKSFSRSPKGGVSSFSANYTKTVADSMGWGPLENGVTSAKLEGRLSATHASLQPKEGPLAKYQIGFDATAVTAFEGVRYEVEGKKNKGHRLELHFKVEFADTTACKFLEEYMTTVGEGKGVLNVSYVKQTTLDLAEVTDTQERLISKEQAKDTADDE
jgi:hypothetical protein